MNDTRHLDDEIQDLLDGRLGAVERARVEEHLASCAVCGAQRDRLVAVKTATWRALRQPEVPTGVSAAITAALDQEQSASRRRWQMAVAATVLAAVVGALMYVRRPGLPAAAASDFARVSNGTLALESTTSEPASLERFFRARGITFRTRVLDLGMMGYRLVGGRVHNLEGRPTALFVYRGPGGRRLVCEMYLGSMSELPLLARRVLKHGGFEFRAYRRGGSTQVFWQEGEVTCVLVSDAPMEEVLSLAVAKAMKP